MVSLLLVLFQPLKRSQSEFVIVIIVLRNFSSFNCGVTSDDVTLEKACQMGSIVTDELLMLSCYQLKMGTISYEPKTILIRYFL